MLKEYEVPEMEIVRFETEDIITTSTIHLDEDELPIAPAN